MLSLNYKTMDQERNISTEYDELDLVKYLKPILKRKWFILFLFLAAGISVGILTWYTPKFYRVSTSLEIESVDGTVFESPSQISEKIRNDIYGVPIREKLGILELDYPSIKVSSPGGTNLINIEIDSDKTEQARSILDELNNLVLEENKSAVQFKKDSLANEISNLESRISLSQKDIVRTKSKIGSLEQEKNNLEAKIEALEKVLPFEQDPGAQFALFDTKEKLETKKREIEDAYSKISSFESDIVSCKNQISSLKSQIDNVMFGRIIKSPTISRTPTGPKLILNVVIAGFLGLFVGILLAFLKEWWDKNKQMLR